MPRSSRSEDQPGLFALDPMQDLIDEVTPPQPRQPEDHQARHAALDTSRSVLVQAPAGAGKTNLLTQRFLALLAQVEQPEQILAITFTRAATAEMRNRILHTLTAAQAAPHPQPGEREEMVLARAALRQSVALGWCLLEQPHRLRIETIDSLCLRLAHAQPLLARLGGSLSPSDNAESLYSTAARRTIALLGSPQAPELADALEHLLLRRDNNLPDLQRLLSQMLARRDAWLGVLPLAPETDVDWEQVRDGLEQPFHTENRNVLEHLLQALQADSELSRELVELARYAADSAPQPPAKNFDISPLRGLLQLPPPSPAHRDHWLALASLLLTQKNEWRARFTKSEGFPTTDGDKQQQVRMRTRMEHCVQALRQHPEGARLLALLGKLRALPEMRYTDDQWRTLRAVFLVLRRAVAELRLVFAENDAIDFLESAQAAAAVLADENSFRGLEESEKIQHLLIDEFQDTSRSQYRLVEALLTEWREGDRRTVFLVGDPLQSIYLFRQAEVALFHQTRALGLPCGDNRRHPCHTLQLTHNFRSHRALVDALNHRLAPVFASSPDDAFVPADAWEQPGAGESLHLHPVFVDKDAGEDDTHARKQEADAVIEVLQRELPKVEAARAAGAEEYRIAVLVRARTHLAAILPALRAAGIPYRAVDLEPLADRPEVHDLFMLLRALLHSGDRLAWLTILRAPWCGLGLNDLHMLCGSDDPALLRQSIPELIESRAVLLSPEGRIRLTHTWQAIEAALATRYTSGNNGSLAAWLERTWMALGGPACVDTTARENIEAFLRLLDSCDPGGIDVLNGKFAQQLSRLCAAPDSSVSEHFGVQIMTMHKAKGLGFEVVLLPGLERATGSDGHHLLAMLERSHATGEHELLLAPLGRRDQDTDATYNWVRKQRKARESDEIKRLLYVACTRARRQLHLFAALTVAKGELKNPPPGSLLAAAWPAFQADIEASWPQRTPPSSGLALAAAAEAHADPPLNIIDRLPLDWRPHSLQSDIAPQRSSTPAKPLFQRGSSAGPRERARGSAMHLLLQMLASRYSSASATSAQQPEQWRAELTPADLTQADLARAAQRILREAGIRDKDAQALAAELSEKALAVAQDAVGNWLLTPHKQASSESAWQTWDTNGNLRTLRVDRTFLAGDQPFAPGEDWLWIIDYKTGAPPNQPPTKPALNDTVRSAWLEAHKQAWRAQLETYGELLRPSAGNIRGIRYGLFFPELLELVVWSDRAP